MEESYFKISISKVLELVRAEEQQRIRKFFLDKLGKATADVMDSYIPTESEVMKMFSHEDAK